ncbi:MAG: LamG-like jellyroll fold domain-containing protein [Sedimentisphaeraceae bacterium JB056]
MSKFNCVCMVMFLLCISVLKAGTLSYWKFEEGSGQEIASEISNSYDLVRGIDISDANDPSWSQGLIGDSAIEYSEGQWCSFADIDDPEVLSSDFLATSFTVEAYFNVSVLPEEGYDAGYHVVSLFNRAENADGYCAGWANYAIRLRTDSGVTYAEGYFTNVGGQYPTITSVVPIRANTTYYVAFSYNQATKEATIRVNSRATSQTLTMDPYNVYEHPYLTIGAKSPGEVPKGFMNGVIDEVRISDTALSEAELLYQSSELNDPDIIAYWKFDEGVGQYPVDEIGDASFDFIRGTSASDWMDPQWTTGIKGDHALSFEATAEFPYGDVCSFINGYTPEADSADLVSSSFTVEAYINMNSLPAEGFSYTRYVVSLCDRSGTYASYWNYSIRVRTENGNTYVEGVSRALDGSWPTVTSTVSLDSGVDYYVAYTYDETTNEASIWVDGHEDTVTFTAAPISNALEHPMFTIGARAPSTSYSAFFDGVIDEVRISRVALPDEKLLSHTCGYWGYSPMDFNKDCVVDAADLNEFLSNWLSDRNLY